MGFGVDSALNGGYTPDARNLLSIQIRGLITLFHGKEECKYGMRTGGTKFENWFALGHAKNPVELLVRFVHVCRSNRACLITFVHEGHHLIIISNNQLAQILDIRSQAWMLANPQVSGVLWIEQVAHFLVVNLFNMYF